LLVHQVAARKRFSIVLANWMAHCLLVSTGTERGTSSHHESDTQGALLQTMKFPNCSTHSYQCCSTHVMHILRSVLQCILSKNVDDDLISSKILTPANTRWPTIN